MTPFTPSRKTPRRSIATLVKRLEAQIAEEHVVLDMRKQAVVIQEARLAALRTVRASMAPDKKAV